MLAGEEKRADRQNDRQEECLAIVVELQGAELRKKDQVIARMEEMLQTQARKLRQSQLELTTCKAALVEFQAAV